MRKFKNPYEFYRLPRRDRKHLIDQCFETIDSPGSLYFPIGLTKEGMMYNYGKYEGILSLPRFWVTTPKFPRKYKTWFKVGAFSPDDYDLDLEWMDEDWNYREKVIKYIKAMNKRDVTYEGILTEIQSKFGGRLQ